ncbi:uncharacterized protein LOC144072708 [Stigmatopora argus]
MHSSLSHFHTKQDIGQASFSSMASLFAACLFSHFLPHFGIFLAPGWMRGMYNLRFIRNNRTGTILVNMKMPPLFTKSSITKLLLHCKILYQKNPTHQQGLALEE